MADLKSKVDELQKERETLIIEISSLKRQIAESLQLRDLVNEKQERLDKIDNIFTELENTDEMKAITDEKVGG